MYNKSVAITGSTIEKTTKYDQFREDKIRMELYRIILSLYDEGCRTFTCNLHSFIGLLGADTIVMLREADKCPEIIFSAVIPATPYPADADKLYHALSDDLMKQADNKEVPSEKDSTGKAFATIITSSVFMTTFPKKSGRCVHPAFPIPISAK